MKVQIKKKNTTFSVSFEVKCSQNYGQIKCKEKWFDGALGKVP